MAEPTGRSPRPEFEVSGLTRVFRVGTGAAIRAVDGVDLTVWPGQRLGIVGESGSGKSTLVRMMAALLVPTSGRVVFRGVDITGLPERRLGELRRRVQMVFQDPRSSLDPRMPVGRIVAEPLRSPALRGEGMGRARRAQRVDEVMARVGLEPAMATRYPHEFSGG
jgi:ABC-type glutathione transport system ATPase component